MMEKKTDLSAGTVSAKPSGWCIRPENLSAELDGEYEFSPEERAHLEQCPRCRGLYASYRLIDDAVSKVMTVDCSAVAARRIRKNVDRELDRTEPERKHGPISFYSIAAKVAAAAVIAVTAFYLVFMDTSDPDDSDEPAAELPTRELAVRTPEKDGAKPVSGSLPAGVDVSHIRLSAVGGDPGFRFTDPAAENRAGQIGVIPEAVKHVWLTDPGWETARTERVFRSCLRQAGIPLDPVRVKLSPDGSLRAVMKISRYAAADLTCRLAAEGLQLVSKVQPQPEQSLFAGSGREPVEYEAVFLRKM
ncbi:MAG: zf-HC2 domain-containing protein [Lentisphaeria bacterium]|nr:zf-HC2 domain-containing protein [Lentisphaeria bacterium]